jgi:hypothetical protein
MRARGFLRETAQDGRTIVHLPLRGGRYARLDAEDADRLLAAGVALSAAYLTRIERGGPHVALPSNRPDLFPVILLARLVTGATPGQRVRYRDGDRLNLTRNNLKVEDRRGTPAVLRGPSELGEEA